MQRNNKRSPHGNGKVFIEGAWLLACVRAAPKKKDYFLCTISDSTEAYELEVVGHEFMMHKSKVRKEQTVIATVKKMGAIWYVCLDGKFDLSSMKWAIVEGSVAELQGFINARSGRVFQVPVGEGMVKIKFSVPHLPMKLEFNHRIETPPNWTIKHNTLVREGFIFQRALMSGHLVEYIQETPLPNLTHNFAVIMAAVKSIPFWQRELKEQYKASINSRLEAEPALGQTISFHVSSNISLSRKNKVSISRVPRSRLGSIGGNFRRSISRSGSFSSMSSMSVCDFGGAEFPEMGADMSSTSSLSCSDDTMMDPVILFWVEFAMQDFKEGAMINIPTDLTIYDPCHPDLGQLMMLKVLKVMKSKAAPILLQAYVSDTNDALVESSKFFLKTGDDLRQDAAVLQSFELLNSIWARHDVRYKGRLIQAKTYKVIPITQETGIIEFVPNCKTLQKIEEYDLLWDDEDRVNMIASACGSYIAAYVLGVRDRHWDNVLVKDDGTVFHIDFGFILGKKPVPDADDLAITGSLYKMMGKQYRDFISICMTSFMVLKMELTELVSFAEMVFPNGARARRFLERMFAVGDPDDNVVIDILKSKLQQAPKSWTTWTKNRIHQLAK